MASSRQTLPRIAALACWIAAGGAPAEPGARWTRLAAPAGIERASALALDGEGRRLAVGGERGVAWGPPSGSLARVLQRGPVQALVFAPGGVLLAGTDTGLLRIEAPGRVRALRIGTGEAARDVRDLDVAAGVVVAATAAGVFRAPAAGDAAWQRVGELPFGEAQRVLLRPEAGGGSELWAVVAGDLWRVPPGGAGVRVPLPSAALGESGVLDLARGAGGTLLVLLPRSLSVRDAAGGWRSERLVLPPGAAPRRVVAATGRLWLATDAGLLVAPGPEGPWRRAGPPAGHVAVSDVVGVGERLLVATAHGLLRHAAAEEVGGAPPAAPVPQSTPEGVGATGDPPVALVQRRALHYLSLDPARMERLWRAARRAGRYPALSLRGDYGRDRDRGYDRDQAFLSGETRYLVDRDGSRAEDYGVSLVLSWDLGAAVYNPEHVDVSREARLVAQLRDDVLDEIVQLYFERQRVLASLAAPPPDASPAALRLRAAELASGLDAWTGGWFTRRLSEGPPSPPQEASP